MVPDSQSLKFSAQSPLQQEALALLGLGQLLLQRQDLP